MKKSLIVVLVLLMVSALVFTGCAAKEEPMEEKVAEAVEEAVVEEPMTEKIKIGVSFYNLTAQYNSNLKDAMYAYMEAENLNDTVEILFMDAQEDPSKQNSQVDTLISEGVQAVILNAGDRDAQVTAVKACVAAGIPVIELCSATAATELRACYVGSEDIVSGRMLAEELATRAGGKGDLVLLHGIVGVNAELRRHEGLQEVLDASYPDITIVTEKICNWSRAEALTAMENIIQSGMNFDIVYAENDEMAMGALGAIKGAGLDKDIVIGGIDAIPDAVQAVLDGDLDVTIFQDAVGQAEKATEVAILAAKGETLDTLYDVPYLVVNMDNAADFLP